MISPTLAAVILIVVIGAIFFMSKNHGLGQFVDLLLIIVIIVGLSALVNFVYVTYPLVCPTILAVGVVIVVIVEIYEQF